MRTVVPLVLRLLVDPNDPMALRGVLRDVANGEDHTFTDQVSLVHLLISLALQATGGSQIDHWEAVPYPDEKPDEKSSS